MKDPYLVLNQSKETPLEVIQTVYESLKRQYSEERFLHGEAGNVAAAKLTELESAWAQISLDKKKEQAQEGDYTNIKALVAEGKLDEAQVLLDACTNHHADWHFVQANIFYKREWHTESKRQLELALAQDPNNPHYKVAYDRLLFLIANPETPPQNLGNQGQRQAMGMGEGRMPCMPFCSMCAMSLCISTMCFPGICGGGGGGIC